MIGVKQAQKIARKFKKMILRLENEYERKKFLPTWN